jgi:hypothetical protein
VRRLTPGIAVPLRDWEWIHESIRGEFANRVVLGRPDTAVPRKTKDPVKFAVNGPGHWASLPVTSEASQF